MKTATQAIDEWNEAHELGTAVIVTLDNGRQVNGFTRSPAWKLGGDAVVSVSNGVGTYLLERVQAVTP